MKRPDGLNETLRYAPLNIEPQRRKERKDNWLLIIVFLQQRKRRNADVTTPNN